MRVLCLLACAVLLAQLSMVAAWGPITHYQYACSSVRLWQSQSVASAARGIPPLGDCLCPAAQQPSDPTLNATLLMIGSDLPDGMWVGHFFTATACPLAANNMHSPVFAGYLIQAAINASDYEMLALAMGYASHVVSDVVGFYTQPGTNHLGYLGNSSNVIDWLTKWTHMLAVDSYVLSNISAHTPTCQPALPSQPLDTDGLDFLAKVNALYHTVNPKFPALSADDLGSCATPWAPAVNQMNKLAALASAPQWQSQLQFFDLFGASSPQQAIAHVDMAVSCAEYVVSSFFHNLIDLELSPEASFNAVYALIGQLFDSGACSPQ